MLLLKLEDDEQEIKSFSRLSEFRDGLYWEIHFTCVSLFLFSPYVPYGVQDSIHMELIFHPILKLTLNFLRPGLISLLITETSSNLLLQLFHVNKEVTVTS